VWIKKLSGVSVVAVRRGEESRQLLKGARVGDSVTKRVECSMRDQYRSILIIVLGANGDNVSCHYFITTAGGKRETRWSQTVPGYSKRLARRLVLVMLFERQVSEIVPQ
jgi:hypothetical protein